jgi:branched-chain amino acid aminotransferase
MSRTWFNGTLTAGTFPVDRAERGLLLGDGLFETMLIVNRTSLWSNMHLVRLEAAARELGIGFDRDRLDDAMADILADAPPGHQVLRVTLTRGSTARGLGASGGQPSLLLTLDPFDQQLMFKPCTLSTSSIRRNPHSVASRLKTLSYIDNIAAAREAVADGSEDALLLNTTGHVASSSIANIFLLKGRTLITPARDQGILTGVMRQVLIHSATHLGYTAEERAVGPEELRQADAVFLTNSLRFMRPVTSIDRDPLPQGDLAELKDGLCGAARLQCGRDPRLIWQDTGDKAEGHEEGPRR